MNNSSKPWQVWIDTGGTFTDCLAYDPQQNLHRVKVLSSSALRGSIRSCHSPTKYKVACNWHGTGDIFRGYQFQLLGTSHPPVWITGFDQEEQLLELSELPLTEGFPADFEITANEEAPILAARLVTQTALDEDLPPMEMRLGSTKGTNAMLERKGADTVLLLTRGFRDLLAIDTQQRPDIFSLKVHKPLPLHSHIIEIDERLDAEGSVLKALSSQEIARIMHELKEFAPASIAIALLHSYKNPSHEQALKQALLQVGFAHVSASSELSPAIKILPRAKTALVNAYLSPIIDSYLQQVGSKLQKGSLKVMSSAGGLVDARHFHPKDSLLSGPAGGVVGAAYIFQLARSLAPQLKSMLALDMGGTSTDVSRYDGEFDYQSTTQVGDMELFSPTLSIETVASGGGSLCYFDGHKLAVGPESAGAYPGPACYGFGGPLALTDINLLLGRLQPSGFGIPIDAGKARNAFSALKEQMLTATGKKYRDEELLEGFVRIANEKMIEAIRKISVRRGFSPAQHALLAFGGAGGQHACQVAALLGIQHIIIPYDAGLLSAFGMGKARIERFVTRQVLSPLEETLSTLKSMIVQLQQSALEQLQQEGFAEEQLEIRMTLLFLRFAGQETTLEIAYSPETDIQQAFREKYESQYGHWLDKRVLELESVQVVASTKAPALPVREAGIQIYQPVAQATQQALVDGQWKEVPMYCWEELSAGALIQGPALISSQNSTIWLEQHWRFSLDPHRNALLEAGEAVYEQKSSQAQPEEVQLELFTNRFSAIAAEMGALLERTSFSVNIKERLDFSCALLDSEGELVVNAPHIPVHLGSLGLCVRQVGEVLPMEAGDVVITNHPRYGGSHLPDITLISPVFVQHTLIGYVANRAHHAEIGGKSPGSMPADACTLAEEGVVIAPAYLIRKGQPQWERISNLFEQAPYPTRALKENLADLNGALASVHFGVHALQKLVEQYGVQAVRHYMQKLKDYACASLEESLTSMDQPLYQAREVLDDGNPLQVRIHRQQQKIHIDFSGTAPVHNRNLNATQAIVHSAVIYVLRLLVNKPVPLNEGMMRHVSLHLPLSLLNPDFQDDPQQCPAVVGGNTEVSQRLVDTLIKALQLSACSQGTMNNLLFGDDTFGYYETIGGGTGAGPGFHGAHAVHHHMTNTRITDPEVLEHRYPVRLDQFSIRQGSGGKGKWLGGDGIIRKLTFLRPVSLTLLSQHRKEQPYGMAGGQPGYCGEQYIIRAGRDRELLECIDQVQLSAGDSVIIKTPGGGGYGQQQE